MLAIHLMEDAVGEKLYSTSDIAAIIGVTRQTIGNWIDDTLFPNAQKVGRNYTVPATDVANVLKNRIAETEIELKRLKSELKQVEENLEQ